MCFKIKGNHSLGREFGYKIVERYNRQSEVAQSLGRKPLKYHDGVTVKARRGLFLYRFRRRIGAQSEAGIYVYLDKVPSRMVGPWHALIKVRLNDADHIAWGYGGYEDLLVATYRKVEVIGECNEYAPDKILWSWTEEEDVLSDGPSDVVNVRVSLHEESKEIEVA